MLDPITLPACGQEDGSSPGQVFPCHWDATTAGNAVGTSYVMPSAQVYLYPDGTLLCPSGTWANDSVTGCEALPTDQLAHTGPADPLLALVAAGLVVVGVALKAVTR